MSKRYSRPLSAIANKLPTEVNNNSSRELVGVSSQCGLINANGDFVGCFEANDLAFRKPYSLTVSANTPTHIKQSKMMSEGIYNALMRLAEELLDSDDNEMIITSSDDKYLGHFLSKFPGLAIRLFKRGNILIKPQNNTSNLPPSYQDLVTDDF
ncbi:hypothetical protein [Suttonella indologenes]|uniref:Uncharacterized protein n=1 Tax=Suttonella indologenes TaxID=13276 RepID=A0A380MZR0_9GAMM|nr:hypothetical protein [Suttonella indologenes]SUO98029.1 Uncharacterised protein [Suttonella indologenes]